MSRVDAHCHFWDPARGDYGWLDAGPAALAPLRRPFAPPELAALNGNRRVIAVQAADTVDETRYLLALAQVHPQILGVVGWADLTRADSAGVIYDLARSPKFKGLRPMLQDLPEDDWILTRPDPDILRLMVKLGLRFDALVLTRHLDPLTRFVAAWPDLPVIIDHCAKPRMGGDLPEAVWCAGIKALAALDQVHCKLSGLLTELPVALRQPEAALAAMRPVVAEVLDAFGPGRVVWGSDWPVLTLAADNALWDQLTDRLLEGLAPQERMAILGGNAERFYGIGGAHG